MKPLIVAEIERIAGDCLTPEQREEIACRVIKIIEDHNRTVALAALEDASKQLVKAGKDSAAKESGGT